MNGRMINDILKVLIHLQKGVFGSRMMPKVHKNINERRAMKAARTTSHATLMDNDTARLTSLGP